MNNFCILCILQFFNNLGYDCYAVSLRGTYKTGMLAGDSSSKVTIQEHIDDITHALRTIRENDPSRPAPIIISHSFGGVVTMKLLESLECRENVSAAAWLCSVPPSGNGPMTLRFCKTRPCDALQIVYGFVFKGATSNPTVCRKLFFDEALPEEDINR